MKKSRLIITLSVIVTALVLLASCSLSLPSVKPEKTETTTETTTLPQPDLSVWEDRYEEFLLSVINGSQTVVGYELEVENCRFGIEDIDGDEIPELLISEGDFPGSRVSIFGYDGFEIRNIGSAGENGEIEFVPGGNKIISGGAAEGQESYIIYSIADFKLIETFNATSIETENGKTRFIDGSEVSEEEYNSRLAENRVDETETAGRNLYELKSEYVLPVVENNTDLIDRAMEENSIRAEEASQQAFPEEATPAQAPEETAEYESGIPAEESGTDTDTYPVSEYSGQ